MEKATKFRRLLHYRPYSKQQLFHDLGAYKRERLLMAGNQQGKSWSGGAEMGIHLTGKYPDWWNGYVFDRPIVAWAAGVTSEQTRDNAQRILFGPEGQWGTGMIPRDAIIETTQARGIGNYIDTARIRHVSGDESLLSFKSYEQGKQKWMGAPVDAIWCDEEPPHELYTEALARTTATKGRVFITFTPLLGMTEIVGWFFPEPNAPSRALVQMTLEDAEHIAPEDRQAEIDKFPAWEREARVQGLPMLGSGRVFPIAESAITTDAFEIPSHWRRIAGIDFGWDHPTAVVWLAWDNENDRLVVTDIYREREQTLPIHADAIKARGAWIPVAWPHDGYTHDPGSGESLARSLSLKSVRMLPEHATNPGTKSKAIEPGIADLVERMQTGRFHVFRHLHEWFDEFRIYHRKDGKVVKERDDLMSATRYASMMLRFARAEYEVNRTRPATVGMDYDPFGQRTLQ